MSHGCSVSAQLTLLKTTTQKWCQHYNNTTSYLFWDIIYRDYKAFKVRLQNTRVPVPISESFLLDLLFIFSFGDQSNNMVERESCV